MALRRTLSKALPLSSASLRRGEIGRQFWDVRKCWLMVSRNHLAQFRQMAALERLADARKATLVAIWIESRSPWIGRQHFPIADIQIGENRPKSGAANGH